MDEQRKSDWESYYDEGKRYRSIVEGAAKKEGKFTPEIIYNLACMSIEKLFMAYFLKVGTMPSNHTLIDLVESMKELKPVPKDLEDKLLHMNNFQEICSIETYQRKIPTPGDVGVFVETLGLTHGYIQELVE